MSAAVFLAAIGAALAIWGAYRLGLERGYALGERRERGRGLRRRGLI